MLGTVRAGMAPRALGHPNALSSTWFRECEQTLADAVEGTWRQRCAQTGEAPSERAADDVWSLAAGEAAPLRR
eukprot:13596462-Alexandrium_andersonii.AAC.1